MKRYGIFSFIVFFELMPCGSEKQEIVNISKYSVRVEYDMPERGFAGPAEPYAISEILNPSTTLYVEIYRKNEALPSVTMKYFFDDGQEKVKAITIPNNIFIINNEILEN